MGGKVVPPPSFNFSWISKKSTPDKLSEAVHSNKKALLGWVTSNGLISVTGAVLSIPKFQTPAPVKFPAMSYTWIKNAAFFPSGCPAGSNTVLQPPIPLRSVSRYSHSPGNQSVECQ